MEAFLAVQTQWRIVADASGRVLRTGLDYAGARAGLELAGIDMSAELFDQIRLIEHGAMMEANS